MIINKSYLKGNICLSCRVEHTEDKGISRQLYTEKSSAFHNQKTTRRNDDKATEPTEDILPYFKRGEQSRAEGVLEEESTMKQMSSKEENTPSSRVGHSRSRQNAFVKRVKRI